MLASFFCMAIEKLNNATPCSLAEQDTPSYALTVYKYTAEIQNNEDQMSKLMSVF